MIPPFLFLRLIFILKYTGDSCLKYNLALLHKVPVGDLQLPTAPMGLSLMRSFVAQMDSNPTYKDHDFVKYLFFMIYLIF